MTPEQLAKLERVARAYCIDAGLSHCVPAGQGAFKATFRASSASGDAIAVKVYLPGPASERDKREIDALREVTSANHPSLPTLIDLQQYTHDGSKYSISTENFFGGGSLAGRVQSQGLLSPTQARALAQELSSALTVTESANLVHRDIKPDNIMFRDDGVGVLVDFGLVRDLNMQSLTQTWLQTGPGTPLYAAPEQLTNAKDLIDSRTDQFALGVTLSYSVIDRHPYEVPGDSALQIITRVANRERPSSEFVKWATNARLDPLIRMVEPWPASRYRRASQLLTAWNANLES